MQQHSGQNSSKIAVVNAAMDVEDFEEIDDLPIQKPSNDASGEPKRMNF